ncbi:MAG: pitrilysin family protein, partial [Cyanobacteria bacterium P01_H01_bin.121]
MVQSLLNQIWLRCRQLTTFLFTFLSTFLLALCLCLGTGLPGITPTALAQATSPGVSVAPILVAEANSIQPYLDRVRDEVTRFQLENGMTFIVLERHQAPVVSFMTYANVGAVDEPDGKTGVAHFLEHMAFKGTSTIGTKDAAAEQKIFTELDQVFAELQTNRAQPNPDPERLSQLETKFVDLQQQASSFVIQNELNQIVERNGGVGMNATTSADETRYFYSLPANKLELWMSLESERFLDPVWREFYTERDVILEERRSRLENQPYAQLYNAVQDAAFSVHPYKRPIIGYEEDLLNITRQDVQEFFEQHYGPENLTIAIVGDVDPAQVRRLAAIYFGRYESRPQPVASIPVEPPQEAQKEVELRLQAQPWYMEAYHIPGIQDPDYVVHDILGRLLSSGRTSRLYKSLVEDQQVALGVDGYSGFPNNKYPNLMIFLALPTPDHDLDTVQTALAQELERLKQEPVTEVELERVKTQARAGLLRLLRSNSSLASLLAQYEAKTGDWQNLFSYLDAIANITPADIQRVANQALQPNNRTVGRLLPSTPAAAP